MPAVINPETGRLEWDGTTIPNAGRESLRQAIAALGIRVDTWESSFKMTAVALVSDSSSFVVAPEGVVLFYSIVCIWTDGATDGTELVIPAASAVTSGSLCLVSATLPETNQQVAISSGGSPFRYLPAGGARKVWVLFQTNGSTWLELAAFDSNQVPHKGVADISHADTPYTVKVTDAFILVDVGSGNVVVNLPAISANSEQVVTVKIDDTAMTSNGVIITPHGAQRIDDNTEYVLTGLYSCIQLLNNPGSNEWQILSVYTVP